MNRDVRASAGELLGSAPGPMNQACVYRTGSGTVFRVTQDEEGHLGVEILKMGIWQTAAIGMTGLRIAKGTRRLTQRQIEALT